RARRGSGAPRALQESGAPRRSRTPGRSPRRPLADADQLVRLEAEPPPGVAHAVGDGALGILALLRPVHRLQQEVPEAPALEVLRPRAFLREHELQLVAAAHLDLGARLGAHADPVDAGRDVDGAVRLDRDLEAPRVQRAHELRVELQRGLAARQHREARAPARPQRGDALGERLGGVEPAAARAVGADEVGVAELAYRVRAVGLAAAPQVAPGEAAEHRRAPRVRALALQRIEDLF